MVEHIAFDTDNTLWHNATYFSEAHQRYHALLEGYLQTEHDLEHLYQVELRNLRHYGYGVKGFGLSMIESAIELTQGRISASDIAALVALTKEMLEAPVQVLPQVEATLEQLSSRYRLLVITQGDLIDQEAKLMRSGLSEYFECLEVVSEKDRHSYAYLLRRQRIHPQAFVMVGNNLRRDVQPVLELGAQAVFIPSNTAKVVGMARSNRMVQLEHIGQVPAWLNSSPIAA